MAKKKSPKISIITPVYNADLYLEECLNSLVNQTLEDIEIICVNDNSKDKSLKILQNFAKKDKRIKIINFDETSGQSRARNVALESVSGEYIGFVDADDFVDLDMFEKMYKKSQNADMVMCQAKVFDDKVKTYKDDAYFALECFDDKFAEKPFTHEDTVDFITEINVSVWNKIYRTKFLKKLGVKFQEGFIYEDLPYFYEVYTQAKKVVLLKEFLYSYRINNQNSTMTRTDKNVKDRVDMASLTYNILKKQKYFEKIKSTLLNTIIHDLFYRCLIINSRYQKEYFFRMQKFFKTLDTTDIDDTLIKSRYYPHFCEIKKRSYDEIIKYFFNQETLGSAYVEHAKKVFKRDFDELEGKKRDFLKEKEIWLGEIDKERSEFEREKSENAKNSADLKKSKTELDKLWKDFEKNKKAKLAELDKLQAKILQDEKNRYAEFEKQNKAKNADFEKQKGEIAQEWKKLDAEREKRLKELDELQDKILQDEKTRWAEFDEKSQQKNEEFAVQQADLDVEWKKFEAEKLEKQAEIDAAWDKFKQDTADREKNLDELQDKILQDEKDRWSKFEEETSQKKSELQAKILQDEKNRYAEFEKQNKAKNADFEKQKGEIAQEWKKLDAEREKRLKELDELQDKILQDEKTRWAEFDEKSQQKNEEFAVQQADLDVEWKKFEAEKLEKQAEIDAAWDKFKQDTADREKNLDELQDKILQDEKDRWSKFEEETSQKKSELQAKEAELVEEFEKKKQDLNKLEAELWQKVNARQEELKKGEYDLDKAWEKFKIDNLTREKELDKKQADILTDEKERWKKYELQVADLERQKVEFAKEKEIMLKEIDRQWSDFEKEKQSQLDELDRRWVDFEKEKEFKLCEIDREHKFEKLTVEKTKNYLSNRYLTEVQEEKTRLVKHYAEAISNREERYDEMLKQQLKLQEEIYKKTDIFKEKIMDDIKKRPKVSIILPVYNVAPYLRQSLDSIIAQTLTDIEIICVDDGSTDDSGKILDEYKEKDNRITVIHKRNAGTGAARNDGLKIATGECIGFVDPDDWILPNMYERLYNILQDKELDIVMFTPDVFNDQTQKHEGFLYFQDSNFPKILDDKIFNKDDISPFSYPMCVWNKLYRKKLFDDNNIDFAEGLDFEDHKVIFKSLFTAKRIYFIREKLYVYRHSRQGSILSDNDTRMFDHIKIYDIVENILKETGNWEKFHLDFLRYKVHNILYYYTMIKPQYKDEYYKKMVKSLQNTQMSEEEFEILAKDYPDLKPIMGDSWVKKIKNAVQKFING